MLFVFCLILHQTLTRNQIFIFFLVPVIIGFSHTSFYSNKKIISAVLILFCLFVTIKYHIRFNEERKFHELNYSNIQLSSNAKKIDKKFTGLKWITPEFKNNPEEEIKLINEVKHHLLSDTRIKMVMTNYSFFSSILNEKLFSPSRWYLSDGTDYPLRDNKYFANYKNLLTNLLRENNIEVIYTIYPQDNSIIYNHFDKNCFTEIRISSMLNSYELKNCHEING